MSTDLMAILNPKRPLIVAPMAGGPSSPELIAAACHAGALGSMGAAYLAPQAIGAFAAKIRAQTNRPFAINLFAPHKQPEVAEDRIATAIAATAPYRRELGLPTPELSPPFEEDFDLQFEAVIRAKPAILSFVFGLLPRHCVEAAHKDSIAVVGTATTAEEALALQEAGVDAIALQGIEAGGHRGIFDPDAEDSEIGLFDLLDACVPKIDCPLIAAGGLMTAGDIRKALGKGARAVQLGTAFLACREAGTSAPYKARLLEAPMRTTRTTRAFSGRLARGIENRFMTEIDAQPGSILPFPAQNKFTRDLRGRSTEIGSSECLSLWAGTGAGDLWTGTAGDLIGQLFPGG
jgi:nitronate monooxygenase